MQAGAPARDLIGRTTGRRGLGRAPASPEPYGRRGPARGADRPKVRITPGARNLKELSHEGWGLPRTGAAPVEPLFTGNGSATGPAPP